MTRKAKNTERDLASTGWIYKWSPGENARSPGTYFHELDQAAWTNPAIFKYHEEFLQNNRGKLRNASGKGSMANVIPWLMSMSLIGAQNFGNLPGPGTVSQDLLPPPKSPGYYSAPNHVNTDAVYQVPSPALRSIINVQTEEYSTAHKFIPPENNGYNDEYSGPAMEQIYSWRTVDFEFDSELSRQRAIDAGHYELENALPLGIEIWKDKIFLTLPRWKKGIPATLATIPRYSREKSPKLRPYPNWAWHDPENCAGLTSVFRVQVDQCDRLWVLDSGQTDIMSDPQQVCPPELFIFDLKTDRLLKKYTLPKKYVKQDSLYSNLAVDIRAGECEHAFAYLADVWRFGIVVYDLFKDKSFRIEHHFFFPDPLSSRYELHGLHFQWTDGIFGLSLSPVDVNNDRTLFFHPMSSFREFAVSTSVLRDEKTAEDNPEMFIPIGKPRAKYCGHSSGSAMDRNGVMFFNMVTRDSIWCWDSRKEYIPQNLGVIGQSNVSLVFPNDIKVDHEPDQSMWALSNKLPMYLYGKLDPHDINYRLFRANVKEAIKNTICDPNYVVPPSEHSYDETC
ncbi:yellow-h isoform X1 [Neodiprion pinetum]|uniref:yellow-h isoform X1 n=2 Tax=Neodiprion pinetum TaxID=441929 RepID=UPI001EDCAA3A|nr:protein yellow-like isoform X1 [Neodiprion pinetum]XP_046466136.1 protein yellow-like isoform X1 [Neodiprion pinetum]